MLVLLSVSPGLVIPKGNKILEKPELVGDLMCDRTLGKRVYF